MIQPGFVFENPRTQSRSVVLESDAEIAGRGTATIRKKRATLTDTAGSF